MYNEVLCHGYTTVIEEVVFTIFIIGTVMPTIKRIGPYRFFFYSNENDEPSHIHIQRERMLAKFWLNPVSLASSTGFRSHELRIIKSHVEENESDFKEAWNEYFSN